MIFRHFFQSESTPNTLAVFVSGGHIHCRCFGLVIQFRIHINFFKVANTNFLKTVESCDTVIEERTNERNGLLLEKSQMEYDLNNETNEALSLPEAVANATAAWETAHTSFMGMAAGPEKDAAELQVNLLRNKMLRLLTKSQKIGDEGTFEKTVELDQTIARIAVLDTILTEVTARKVALQAQAA